MKVKHKKELEELSIWIKKAKWATERGLTQWAAYCGRMVLIRVGPGRNCISPDAHRTPTGQNLVKEAGVYAKEWDYVS